VLAGSVLVSMSMPSKAVELVCPEKIQTVQTSVGLAAGWKEFVRPDGSQVPGRYSLLAGIDLYDGDPAEIAQLRPDQESAHDSTWSFSQPAPPQRPLYMACVYFNTRIQVVKALPLNVKKCTTRRGGRLRCEEFKN
jgi:hypothetical protein